jgi:hypothetical protein
MKTKNGGNYVKCTNSLKKKTLGELEIEENVFQ